MVDAAFEDVTWLDANDNPFGIRVLDCRSFARSMTSTTMDPELARRFVALRDSTGRQHVDRVPENALTISSSLHYPALFAPGDGPLSMAQEMEDKWDVYSFEDTLYFARSWSDELSFAARYDEADDGSCVVEEVVANARLARDDQSLAVRQVDFLIKSHLFDLEVPHPLPRDLPEQIDKIVSYSFSQYGRRAAFATYEDTLSIDLSHLDD